MRFVEEEGVVETASGRTIGWMLRGPAEGSVIGWFHGQPGSRRDVRAFPEEALSRYGVRLLAIDRAGYGDTRLAGLDRRDVARDLVTVADHFGVEEFPVIAMSTGGVYALALAAIVPERITKVVLVSAHVLPHGDPAIVAGLSPADQAEVARLLGGRTPELEAEYEAEVAPMVEDPLSALQGLAQGWDPRERAMVKSPMMKALAESVKFGLSAGYLGLLEDALRKVRPLEFALSDIRCPVRAIHGTRDDFEPYANLERAASRLPDCVVVSLVGMGHFGPLLWPDSLLGLVSGH